MTISSNALSALILIPWAVLWLLGGVWLARAAFHLRQNEAFLVGIALGWIIENWLANLLAQVLPLPLASWMAGAIVFFGGGLPLVLRSGWKELFRTPVSASQLLILAGLIYIFYGIARGTAIFDDFTHLSTVSVMATGDIPPHFTLDPSVVFGYHHFLLMFSAQLMRIGSLLPWVAVDASRAISFGLAVMLGALFTQRLTRSLAAGFLGGVMIAFGSGTRWLLLLAPAGLVAWLGKGVHLIGSGAGSGATLPEALVNSWAVEGSGPAPFPFAFANGIFPPGVIQAHSANGLVAFVIIFLLLMTFNRWRMNWLSGALTAALISVWGLLGEAELPGVAVGWAVVALACLLMNRAPRVFDRLPRKLWIWLGVIAAGGVVGVLEGGAWTDILIKTVDKLSGHASATSYQTIGFAPALPPVVVSSHLGVLSLLDPRTLVVALLELGPVLLVFPLLVAWGIKAFRLRRWYEAATAATAVIMLLTFFVQFNGSTGVRNTPRLYVFMPLLAAFAVPLFWIWAARRSAGVKALVAALGLVTVIGGLVMFGIELLAIQRPVLSYFIEPLDVRMARAYWNRLEPGALVFDQVPYRAPTVLGRPTDSSFTWYQTKPEWDALRSSPDPVRLRAAGFSYFYLDDGYFDDQSPQIRQALSGGCVTLIGEAADKQGHFRRLLDLRGCH